MVNEGDLVIVYFDEESEFMLEAKKGVNFSTHEGTIRLADLVGQEYGAALKTHLGKFFYLLKPSTSDLMMKVKRLTTIVYPKDAGFMLLKTAIGPGSEVVEIGTGSGAMTILLANTVRPKGTVHTYERRVEFVENSRRNVRRCGLGDVVQFYQADAALEGVKQHNVDAVFIDIPEPWSVIAAAREALAGGHHLVSLSPNIEQIRRTKETLDVLSFKRTEVCEIAVREMLVRRTGTRPRERSITHTAYLLFSQKASAASEVVASGEPTSGN